MAGMQVLGTTCEPFFISVGLITLLVEAHKKRKFLSL